MKKRMRDRTKIMNDYFEKVTKDELLHDLEKTGMFNKRVPIEVKTPPTAVIVSGNSINALSPRLRGEKVLGATMRRREKINELKKKSSSNS
ncbi:hypothetical protein COL08_00760 [Priestia megaterium]|uniref:hypothetical protein n=1 Tax=Priestia megaterium TaxID=1404 RepID=UPI000BF9CBA5|nr:hypothetical protein [Priestia megaterium]PFW00285.1 hypothetical protein COL08_00760 [Priestia megaterium]